MSLSLSEHHAVLLDMLEEFDRVCKKHNIQYMLFSGTALGAVRHQGFVPWDDDVDVIMLRSEYERFFAVAAEEFDRDKYYVQKEFSEHWPMFFSKLRLNHSACIEKYRPKDRQMHQGIFLDIFPLDNAYDKKFLQKLQYYASRIVIAKSLDRRGYATDSAAKILFMALCRLLPYRPFLRFAQNRKHPDSRKVHSFFAASSIFKRSVLPREFFLQTTDVSFERLRLPISAQYDAMLTTIYGDYMTLPPEKDRVCKRHAVIVDTEKDYTEYLDYQMKMDLRPYSKSLR